MEFQYRMLVNGEWVSSSQSRPVRNPYNDALLGHLPIATPDQIESAIQAAAAARPLMAQMPVHQRKAILEKTARRIEQNRDQVIRTIVQEAGKAWKWAQAEVNRACENLRFAAEETGRIHGETIPMDASVGSENRFGVWIRVPVGVVAAISPFNFPLNLVLHKVAPALAAGNTVVLKPASSTPGAAQLLGEFLLESGLPGPALNILYGSGATVGEAIVQDERIAKITFTGSPPVGRRIKQISGLKKITLELGANSGVIVDESADIDWAVSRCLMGSFAFSGQVCISVQRIYLHEKIAAEFTEKFVAGTRALVVGDPMDPSTDIGPLITEAEAERVAQWLAEAVNQGAQILTGGRRQGKLFEPTVLTQVKPEMKLMCLEAFAPVVALVPCSDFNQAVRLVDDSIYGLQAGIFTRNLNLAFHAARAINVGGVIINDVPTYRVDHMPYGGNKESGLGREGARFAIEEMTNIKMLCFNLTERP